MMNVFIRLAAIASVLALCVSADADPWKDESGHGRGGAPDWRGGGGEPPDWTRGRGVWDGHVKQGRGGPPPWAGREQNFHGGRYGTGYRGYQQPWSYGFGQPYSGGYSGYGTTYNGGYYSPYRPYETPYSYTPYPSFGW